MPQVKPPRPRYKEDKPPVYVELRQESKPQDTMMSVGFAIILLVSIVVVASTWLGGGMPRANSHASTALDAAARQLGFSVRNISVYGLSDEPQLEQATRLAARIEPGENMWRAQPHRIRDNILSLGQVTNVRVARYWPNQVVIFAEPINPIAILTLGEGVFWVDSNGLKIPQTEALVQPAEAVLPRVRGAGGAAQTPALLNRLGDAGIKAQAVQWHKARRWVLTLATGEVVHLPAPLTDASFGASTGRLAYLQDALQAHDVDADVDAYDLRVAGRIIVKSPQIPKIKHRILQGVNHG